MAFPVGYYALHPDVSLNFQMNRWYGWVGEPEMLDQMRAVAPRITGYGDWKREFLALAAVAVTEGHVLRSGFYHRSAEFFMDPDDPDRVTSRRAFLEAVASTMSLPTRELVPFVVNGCRGSLPAYRFSPAGECRGTVLFFGGFDSYVEELAAGCRYLADRGYDVIAFEGPGQGGALLDEGLTMIPDWGPPVAAVLSHFQVDRAAVLGLSMGGCLAIVAAAAEPRVDRVIAYDILTDFRQVSLGQLSSPRRRLLSGLVALRLEPVVNALVRVVARRSPVLEWGIAQGMHVLGAPTPYALLRRLSDYQTRAASPRVHGDVLLLAGAEDHYVPIGQLADQRRWLTGARSLTARVFTTTEHAQNHCQVGNYGLAYQVIADWLDAHPGA